MIYLFIVLGGLAVYLALMAITASLLSRIRPALGRVTVLIFLVGPFAGNYLAEEWAIFQGSERCSQDHDELSMPPPAGGVFIHTNRVPENIVQKHAFVIASSRSLFSGNVSKRYSVYVPELDSPSSRNQREIVETTGSDHVRSFCETGETLGVCLGRLFPDLPRYSGVMFPGSGGSVNYTWRKETYAFWRLDLGEPVLISKWESLKYRKRELWQFLTFWTNRDFFTCSTNNLTFSEWYEQGL